MIENIWRDVAMALGFFHVAAPVVVRSTFRFAKHCQPVLVGLDEMPIIVSARIAPRIPQMEHLGFELVGCYDCGELTNDTKSFVGYFVNRKTNDFANVTVVVTVSKTAHYFEFSTRLTNGMAIETNTNRILPLTPGNPETRVFRFPEIVEPEALYEVHQQLVAKYGEGFCAQGEPRGEEIQRMVRVVENYGPRHAKIGYMYLAENGEHYRLTWKGALLMTWRALWPTIFLLRMAQRNAMRNELNSLQAQGMTELVKA